jgi:hypothetical protein
MGTSIGTDKCSNGTSVHASDLTVQCKAKIVISVNKANNRVVWAMNNAYFDYNYHG